MTSRSTHPTLDEWRDWSRGTLSAQRRAQLDAHLRSCQPCSKDARLVTALRAASRVGPMEAPPRAVRERLRRLPAQRPAPPASARAHAVRWAARDVRGGGGSLLSGTQETLLLARTCPGAEISIMATPPSGNGSWRIEGRVWLHRAAAGTIGVVLAHQDHVLAASELSDGGHFCFEEPVGRGWSLEFHLPHGNTLRVEDPRA